MDIGLPNALLVNNIKQHKISKQVSMVYMLRLWFSKPGGQGSITTQNIFQMIVFLFIFSTSRGGLPGVAGRKMSFSNLFFV